jgi:hypothetical protein
MFLGKSKKTTIKLLRIVAQSRPVYTAWYPRRLESSGQSKKIFLNVKASSFSET